MNKSFDTVLAVLSLAFAAGVASAADDVARPITDAEIRAILKDRVDRTHRSVGIVVGIVDENGTRFISYGKIRRDGEHGVDADSVYDLASIGKVFTTTLLADMVERGEVSLDDPISKYLPRSVKAPTRNGKEILLRHLATHTSGLPRDADNLVIKDIHDIYAGYTPERLYAFLSNHKLARDPGATNEYSSVGAGLLGHILELRSGMDYDTLLRARICKPLQMDDTGNRMTPRMQEHLAIGHSNLLRIVPKQTYKDSCLTGSGGVNSSAHDLMKFLAAYLGLTRTPLNAAMTKALGWALITKFDSEIHCHTGASSGYFTFLGFDRKKGVGVAVLSNVGYNDIGDIAVHILNSRFGVKKPTVFEELKAVKMDPAKLDLLVGEYEFKHPFSKDSPVMKFVFRREGEKLMLGTEKVLADTEVFAASETKFFDDNMGSTMTFVKNDKEEVTHLVYELGTLTSMSCKKVK